MRTYFVQHCFWHLFIVSISPEIFHLWNTYETGLMRKCKKMYPVSIYLHIELCIRTYLEEISVKCTQKYPTENSFLSCNFIYKKRAFKNSLKIFISFFN